jgi:hypothetical protein
VFVPYFPINNTSLRQTIFFEKLEGLSEVTHIMFQLVFICVSLNWNLIGRSRVEVRNEEGQKTVTGRWTGRCTGRIDASPPRSVPATTSVSGHPEDQLLI